MGLVTDPKASSFILSLRNYLVILTQSVLNCVSDVCSQPQLRKGQLGSHTALHEPCGTHQASQLGANGDGGHGHGLSTWAKHMGWSSRSG